MPIIMTSCRSLRAKWISFFRRDFEKPVQHKYAESSCASSHRRSGPSRLPIYHVFQARKNAGSRVKAGEGGKVCTHPI
jgi:hypothetical protein